MQGFVVFDYWERFPEAEAQLRSWAENGELIVCEDVADGLKAMPQAVASLFTGANTGVKICRVGNAETQ